MFLCAYCLKIIVLIRGISCQLGIITDKTPLTERGPCISSPCLHNGLCTIVQGGFICTCVDGYIGVMCERRSDDCPIDNSLECVYGLCKLDMNGDPRCICNDGYGGVSCALPTDGCNSEPCLNKGKCIDMGYSYKCLCPKGTLGSHCQLKQNVLERCLTVCDGHLLGGKCWHTANENVSVSWGYGDLICNSKHTCFDMPSSSNEGIDGYMEVQIKPISMQYTDNLIFVTDNDYTLNNDQFVPHILPMETSSESAFISCNISHGQPLTNDSSISQLHVHRSFLKLGTQYFLADINALYRCVFGLRLNVTVKNKNCDANGDSDILCNGRGRCFSDFNRQSYECLCCEGYIGKYCEYEDPCLIKACKNGGTCDIIDYGGGILKHYCACARGYIGDTCDKISNPCVNNECQNGGVCEPVLHSYRCNCKPGFNGIYCEIIENHCANILCQNGATCVAGIDSPFCKCQDGYKGTLCEIDINECGLHPCVEGTCIDHINNYTCACKVGRKGRNCEEILEECYFSNCTNGVCVVEESEASCSCGIGYTGLLCEIKIDLCSDPKFCLAANSESCQDHDSNVTCVCRAGWSGENCAVNINDCTAIKCKHDGNCVDKLNSFDCICRDNYTGRLCEEMKNKSIADIEIKFAVDTCEELKTIEGIKRLESHIVELFEQNCNCSFSLDFIKPRNTPISCRGEKDGIFMTDLKFEDQKHVKSVLCNIASKPLPTNVFFRDLYIVAINVNNKICLSHTQVTESTDESYSKTGMAVGIIVGVLLIIVSFLVVSTKVRNIRRKIGASETSGNNVMSFDNTIYTKDDILKDDKLGETSFTSSNLPKWPVGSNRSGNVFERNKRQSPCRKSC